MTTDDDPPTRSTSTALTARRRSVRGALRDRPVTVLGLARSGLALARFLADAGARVTVYDGRPAADLARGDRGARRPAGDAGAGAGRRSRGDLGGRGARRHLALDHARLPDDRAAPARRARGRSSRRGPAATATAPALVSEADLFLRLCPAPTIGVTGTKGKTTTSSLTAAILAADPDHPVVLGGNIGIPIVERLPRADARAPGRRRAVRAPAADPVARHDGRGLHERHLGPPRPARVARGLPAGQAPAGRAGRPGRRARPQRRGPGRRRVRRPGRRRGPSATGAIGRCRAGSASVDGWIVADDVRAAGRWPAADRRRPAGRPDHAGRRAGDPRRPQRLERPGRGRRRRSLFGVGAGRRSARGRARSRGVEHRLEPVAIIDGVRFINDSQGTQPDAVDRGAPRVRAADRADRRRPRQGHRPDRARPGRRRAGRRRGPHRRERPGPRAPRSGRPASPARSAPATSRTAVRRADAIAREALRRADRRRPQARRRSCSARPPPASTCSSTTPPAAGRSRPPSRRSPRPDRGGGPMNLAPPIPRLERAAPRPGRPAEREPTTARRPTGRRSRAGPGRSVASATRPTT